MIRDSCATSLDTSPSALVRSVDAAAALTGGGSVKEAAVCAGTAATAFNKRVGPASKFIVMLRGLARTTAEACGFDRCSIFVQKDDRLVPVMSQFASGKARDDLWPLFMALGSYAVDEVPAFARAIRQRRPLMVPYSPDGESLPREWQKFGGACALVVPLFGERTLVGVMVLDGSAADIGQDQIRRARVLGRSVASAIDRPVSAMQMRSQLHAAETLLSIGRTIGSTLELQEVVRRITRETAKALGADSAGIYLLTKPNKLEPFAGYHMPKEILDSIASQSVPVFNVQELRLQWTDDAPNDRAFQDPIFRQFRAQSLILAPLRAQDEIVGMLACAWWTARHRPGAGERQLVQGIAAQAAAAIINARLYAETAQAAIAAERIRIDNLLHDTFRQTLFSIGLRIERCLRSEQRLSAVRAIIRDIKRDVGVMMDQVNLVGALDSAAPALQSQPRRAVGETDASPASAQ